MRNAKAIGWLAAMLAGFGVAPTLAGPTVYIPLGSANQVIAVDAADGRITKSYPGVDNPHGLVATPDGEYLIAGSLKEDTVPPGAPHDTPNSKLYVIHPVHGHVMRTVAVTGWTHHQAITPDGRYVLSTHPTRGYVSVVDVLANKVVRTVATGSAPNFTLIARDGRRAYVSNSGDGTLAELDLGRCALGRAKRGRVVRGRRGLAGAAARPSRRKAILWASMPGAVERHARPQGGRGPGEQSETRDTCAVTECARGTGKSCRA